MYALYAKDVRKCQMSSKQTKTYIYEKKKGNKDVCNKFINDIFTISISKQLQIAYFDSFFFLFFWSSCSTK